MTKKELMALKTQIEEYLPELKTEIDSAKNDLRNARTLKTQIEGIVSSTNELLENLKDPTTGVDATLASSKSGLDSITANSESATTLLEKIQGALEDATQHVTDMEASYENFTSIKEKIDDPDKGLAVTLTEIKKVRGRAKEAATKAESTLKSADSTLVQIQKYITRIDKEYAAFLDSKKKADDPTDGLDAILKTMKKLRDTISAVADKSNTLFAQINSYKDEAVNSLKDINDNKESAETALGTIQDYETNSESAKQNIDQLLKIASQNTSTSYFKKRARLVSYVAGVWLAIGIGALAMAVFLGHELVKDIIKDNNISAANIIARSLTVTPTLAFSFYAFRNYGKERAIAEQYAFKEISGATIEGHIEMAHRAFPESKTVNEKLEDVLVSVTGNLHSEPAELQKTSKNVFRVRSKLMDLEAEITDISDNVEDIKNIVSKSDAPDSE